MTIADTLKTDALTILTGTLASGEFVDISSAGRNAINYGGFSVYDATIKRDVMHFDATTTYAEIDQASSDWLGTQVTTMAFWHKKDDATARSAYCCGIKATASVDCYSNIVWVDNRIYWYWGGSARFFKTATHTYTDWNHFIFENTKTPASEVARTSIWLNGNLWYINSANPSARTGTTVKFRINGAGSTTTPYAGDLAKFGDLVIMNRVLTPAEMAFLSDPDSVWTGGGGGGGGNVVVQQNQNSSRFGVK